MFIVLLLFYFEYPTAPPAVQVGRQTGPPSGRSRPQRRSALPDPCGSPRSPWNPSCPPDAGSRRDGFVSLIRAAHFTPISTLSIPMRLLSGLLTENLRLQSLKIVACKLNFDPCNPDYEFACRRSGQVANFQSALMKHVHLLQKNPHRAVAVGQPWRTLAYLFCSSPFENTSS